MYYINKLDNKKDLGKNIIRNKFICDSYQIGMFAIISWATWNI